VAYPVAVCADTRGVPDDLLESAQALIAEAYRQGRADALATEVVHLAVPADARGLLQQARLAAGVSPAGLAIRLRVAKSYVSLLESGTRMPSTRLLWRWAAALGYEVALVRRRRGVS
jgi:hypothetical protein